MRLAVITDVHGNAEALEAVLEDITRRSADMILDLGDRVSGPLWPQRTFRLFAERKIVGVRGNHDRQLGDRPRNAMGASDAHAFDQLSTAEIAVLTALPERLEPIAGAIAFHAQPGADDRYLTERITEGRLVHREPREIEAELAALSQTLVLCGHSHRPFTAQTSTGRMVMNPGSVGCPAYADDAPPHVSESGQPHARYAILTLDARGAAAVEMIALRYDWDAAAREATRNDRPEWAFALRTGRMPAGG